MECGANVQTRIIPARAGFTAGISMARILILDHPRSRGVYLTSWSRQHIMTGSSPLARGLQRQAREVFLKIRIIPARAGFTDNPTDFQVYGKDHPRSRGVYRASICASYSLRGSSPLARGLLGHEAAQDARVRIIPARAGFTSIFIISGSTGTDHPRSRGVYSSVRVLTRRAVGSSPLARGLRPPSSRNARRRRIIPARAGFTREYSWRSNPRRDHPRSRGVYVS